MIFLYLFFMLVAVALTLYNMWKTLDGYDYFDLQYHNILLMGLLIICNIILQFVIFGLIYFRPAVAER